MLATILLATTGLAAGLTGTWSPCGFSMLTTLGPTGHTGGRRTTFAACSTFALGALAGGAATFTALAHLGRALGGGGSRPAAAGAVAVALAAAVGEARGVRVLPQVRRQVPEHWRRAMPMPVAGGLYGVLLGLGFTTFVLTLAVWALAAITVALGDPHVGLTIGLAFGAGRALPVVVLAPWIDGRRGLRCAELMAERPVILRSLRRVDGLLLLSSALALLAGVGTQAAAAAGQPFVVTSRAAQAAAAAGQPFVVTSRAVQAAAVAGQPFVVTSRAVQAAAVAGQPFVVTSRAAQAAAVAGQPFVLASPATDPSVSDTTLAWATPGGPGHSRDVGSPDPAADQLDGAGPALGGGNLAVHNGPDVTVTAGPALVGHVAIPGLVQIAVSGTWLAARALDAAGHGLLYVVRLPAFAPITLIAAEPSGVDLGRPAIDGDRVVVALNGPRSSRIVEFDLAKATHLVLRSSRGSQLLNPSLRADGLLYVEATRCDQRLVLGSSATPAHDRTLLRIGGVASRDAGHEPHHTSQGSEPSRCPAPGLPRTPVSLWTTALGPLAAYVTELAPNPPGTPSATLVGVPLN